MKLYRRRNKKTGLPPGTLVYLGDSVGQKTTIELIDYNSEGYTKKTIQDVKELETCLNEKTVSWININGLNDLAIIEEIGRIFKIHPLVLEDIVNTDQRPKFQDYEEYFYIVLKMLTYDEQQGEIQVEQVSMILGSNYLITFQEHEGDVFDIIRERIQKNKGKVRKELSDYLSYVLIDAIVDHYFNVMEWIADETERMESDLLENPTSSILKRIHDMRHQLIFLRKSVWPLRESLVGLERSESELIKDSTKVFFQDIYDHTIQIIDTVENLRDIVTGMLDVYLSTVSNRMNEVMKVLTIIATIFIPLTFIAGVYGMNFRFMPELSWRYGYPVVLVLMLFVGIAMLVYFRRRKWL
jgi:magnesium transporter